jgi:hypothetical protein
MDGLALRDFIRQSWLSLLHAAAREQGDHIVGQRGRTVTDSFRFDAGESRTSRWERTGAKCRPPAGLSRS